MSRATGIDVGLRTVKFLRGQYKANTFHVSDVAVVETSSKEIADGWAVAQPGFKVDRARVGLTGKDVNIRYTRVPRVPDWQLRNLMRFEVEEIGDQSGSGVASDFNVLPAQPEIEGEDVVLLAMARESLLEQHAAGLKAIGGRLDAFTPNSIALYNAYLRFGTVQDDTTLLANIGYDNVDVVIVRGPDLLFARNLTGGSRLFEDAIAQRFGIEPSAAVALKHRSATLEPGVSFTDANQEKASRACLAAAGQLLSLLQSTVLFCKSQVKISGLKLDRVLLCGGGSAQAGLPRYLATGLGVPVEHFDPFRVVDTSRLGPEALEDLERHKLGCVVALGLATMACDPDAYAIEILPVAVRKRREFLNSRLYLIAAGVLAVLYLGIDAYRTSRDLGTMTARAEKLGQQYKRASQTHAKTVEILAENAALARLADTLHGVKGSGEQIARTIDVLERELPSDFWLTHLSSSVRADPDLAVPRDAERPIVSITGKAREGTSSLASLYEGFIRRVREKLPERLALKERLTPTGSKFTLDLTLFAPAAAAAAGDPAGDSNGDPENSSAKPESGGAPRGDDARTPRPGGKRKP